MLERSNPLGEFIHVAADLLVRYLSINLRGADASVSEHL